MMYLDEESLMAGKSTRDKVAKDMIKLSQNIFKSFEGQVISKMNWCNPEYWMDVKDFGIDGMSQFFSHLKEPMASAHFVCKKAIKGWENIQLRIKQNLLRKPVLHVWKIILQCKKTEFPNICLLVEISSSNSSVPRAFGILTMMLTDRRLKSSHALLEMQILVKVSNKSWNDEERDKVLTRTSDIYVSSKKRKGKLDALKS